MARSNAVLMRQKARDAGLQRLAVRLNTSKSTVHRALRGIDGLSSVLAALGLQVVEL